MNGVMSATDCFDLGYIVSDILEDERDTAQEQSQRFLPPLSEEELRERVRRRVPRGTAKANSWAFSVWREWACHHNTLVKTQQDRYFPVLVYLVGFSYEALDYWMSLFIMEVRRVWHTWHWYNKCPTNVRHVTTSSVMLLSHTRDLLAPIT